MEALATSKRTIPVSTEAVALVLEDDLQRRAWFLSKYRIPRAFVSASNENAIRIINTFSPTVVFLDYDLGPGITSEPTARHLAASGYAGTVHLHSQNPFGVQLLQSILPHAMVARFGEFELLLTR